MVIACITRELRGGWVNRKSIPQNETKYHLVRFRVGAQEANMCQTDCASCRIASWIERVV